MSAVYRNVTTKPMPAGAVIRTKSGQRLAEWTSRGAVRRAEVVGDRIRIPSATYWARWRDAAGTEVVPVVGVGR